MTLKRAVPLLFVASLALAHVPAHITADAPFVLDRPTFSALLMGEFVTGEEHFVIKLTHATRFCTPVELLVPHQQDLLEHRPAWAVVGPGLPAPTAEELEALPAPLPTGWGAVVDLNDGRPRVALFESVMRRFFWTSVALAVIFPKGDSEIWVWSPGKTRGKFGLGYGVEEGGGFMKALDDWAFYAY